MPPPPVLVRPPVPVRPMPMPVSPCPSVQNPCEVAGPPLLNNNDLLLTVSFWGGRHIRRPPSGTLRACGEGDHTQGGRGSVPSQIFVVWEVGEGTQEWVPDPPPLLPPPSLPYHPGATARRVPNGAWCTRTDIVHTRDRERVPTPPFTIKSRLSFCILL